METAKEKEFENILPYRDCLLKEDGRYWVSRNKAIQAAEQYAKMYAIEVLKEIEEDIFFDDSSAAVKKLIIGKSIELTKQLNP